MLRYGFMPETTRTYCGGKILSDRISASSKSISRHASDCGNPW